MSKHTPKIKVDVPALIHKMQAQTSVNELPRHLTFRCCNCHGLYAICLMFVGDDRKPRCAECAERRLKRPLKLEDFPSVEMARRVACGEPVTCSEAIKMTRKCMSMTQAEFAGIVGVSRQMLIRWEDGRRYPDYDHSVTLCELGVTAQVLPALQ